MNWTRSAAVTTSLVLGCASLPTLAALGGSADSVRSDAAALRSQLTARAGTQAAYTVQRLSLDDGTVVDQYISSAGKVFAVNWRGPRPPDLTLLFGEYFTEYDQASTRPHKRQSHMQIDTGRMRYVTGGHMRAYWGTAYVPALLPAGLTMEDVQ